MEHVNSELWTSSTLHYGGTVEVNYQGCAQARGEPPATERRPCRQPPCMRASASVA
jgi:hypothetical protein